MNDLSSIDLSSIDLSNGLTRKKPNTITIKYKKKQTFVYFNKELFCSIKSFSTPLLKYEDYAAYEAIYHFISNYNYNALKKGFFTSNFSIIV